MATSYYAALLAATFPVVTPNEPVGSMDGASGRSAVFGQRRDPFGERAGVAQIARIGRSEEHTSELQSLMSNSYAVFCLINNTTQTQSQTQQTPPTSTINTCM